MRPSWRCSTPAGPISSCCRVIPATSREQAEAAARAALDAGAELLIGPLYGRSAVAVAPAATARGVSVISFSNDATIARPGLYVMGFRPEEQIQRIVRYAGAQGRARMAALAPEDAYGERALAAFRSTVATVPGATAVITQTYPAQSDSPRDAVEYVAAFGRPDGLPAPVTNPDGSVSPPPGLPPPGFDALLIADGGPRVLSIAALLASYDVTSGTTPLLGTMRWQDDAALLADPSLRGSWLATWPPDAIGGFMRRFAGVYGRQPAPLAVLAYDATALAVLLVDDATPVHGSPADRPAGLRGRCRHLSPARRRPGRARPGGDPGRRRVGPGHRPGAGLVQRWACAAVKHSW